MFSKLLLFSALALLGGKYLPLPILGQWGTFAILLISEIAVNLVVVCYLWPFVLSPLRKLPGPKDGHFLFGHALEEMGRATGVLAWEWGNKVEHTDFIRYTGFFGEEKLLPMSPDTVRQLLTHEDVQWPPELRKTMAYQLGDGLVLAEGPRHRRMKKALGPAFTPSQQRHLVPDMWKQAQRFREKLIHAINETPNGVAELNMSNWTNYCTFDILGATAWGADFKALDDPSAWFELFDRNFPIEGFKGWDAFYVYVLPIFVDHGLLNKLPIKRYQSQLTDRRLMNEGYLRYIEQRRSKDMSTDSQGNHKDMLSVMINTKDLTEYDLIENAMTFTAAGFATNAASLIWAIYILATKPEVAQKLRAEIRKVIPDPTQPIASTDMDAIRYLHYFVMEVTRLYPSIPNSWKQAMKDVTINGVKIPKGTQMVIPSFAINRSRAVWGPSADEFIPERWDPENRKPGMETNGSYMTFMIGPKACIGKEYALRALKAILIGLAGSFEFGYDGEDPMKNLVPGLTLRPRGGLMVKLSLAK
ncbi:hypothetical protein SLS56_009126 [Neofusicoccum ribis]|uniref:Cytochrome P450 n=1 Tax=Neofusicoccum ribis TaxID=45134 RepID=A0ABR3SI82_9PEZI